MNYNRRSAVRRTRVALSLGLVFLASGSLLAGTGHWGPYIQGHTPAYVPHNMEHGFNQTRWRRWPGAWEQDYQSPAAAAEKRLSKPGKEETLPPPEDDDAAPAPPNQDFGPEAFPDDNAPDPSLQPVPPADEGPTPPPGLTRPDEEMDEPALGTSPSDAEPPANAEPALPELDLPEEPGTLPGGARPRFGEPTPAGPPSGLPAPRTPPTTTPALPVPPTDLPQVTPPESRLDSHPVQARTSRSNTRREQASEAVYRGGRYDKVAPAPRNQSETTESLPVLEESPQPFENQGPAATSEELQLFPPANPPKTSAARGRASNVRSASHSARIVTPASEPNVVLRSEVEVASPQRTLPAEAAHAFQRSPRTAALEPVPEPVAAPAVEAPRKRNNPLRGAVEDSHPTTNNPLRP